MTYLVWLVDFAYVLIVFSYLVKDMFWLRILAVCASVCMITFNFLAAATPLWIMIRWNTVMLVINLVQIFLLLRAKHLAILSEEEKELHATVFPTMSKVELKKLLRLGRWWEIPAGQRLAGEGQVLEHLILLYNGAASVVRNGNNVARLKDGDFIGEMSFMRNRTASATVTAESPLRVIEWPSQSLKDMLVRNPNILISLQASMGSNMARKLSTDPDS